MLSDTHPGLVDIPVLLGDRVFTDLSVNLQQYKQSRVVLVADENTFQACGQLVTDAVKDAGLVLEKLIFPGQPCLKADESSLVQVLQALDGQEHLLLAVGSGTITDIVRYVAFQTRLPFISIPTAASVDAYTSFTAAINLKLVKHSILTIPPRAVYAHLPTLSAAPSRLTASGFSDMIAKYTALADWKLAHLLVGDAYNDVVAAQARMAVLGCSRNGGTVRTGDPAGIAVLIDGLMISGRCMLTEKSSRPAAGAEHSLAHFWEIYHQRNRLPESLHGEKTGVGSVLIARLYEELRRLSPQEAARRLAHFNPPDLQAEAVGLETAFGPIAQRLIASRPSFLGAMRYKIESIKTNLIAHWDEVQAAAATVPTAAEITTLLESAGSASMPDQIHIQGRAVTLALANAMYIRDRFTILELNRMLDLVPINDWSLHKKPD